jgi:protein tyrosine phosphatase (PTP) superfamily phosphohydrolase (DUF442 family)
MTKKIRACISALGRSLAIAILALCASMPAFALEDSDPALDSITNFRQYSPTFASAGQPNREQFQAVRDAGFERVVYIAFTNSGENAIPEEDTIVKELGMEYLQIPVDFKTPLPSEFYAFADAMRRYPNKKTLLHCQVNARATAFSFLYRVIYADVPIAEAKADMNTVWQPFGPWRDFIFAVLAENQISPNCEDCDWSTPEQ